MKRLSPYPFDGDGPTIDRWCVELAEHVERWQKRLSPLGVAHFRIDSVSLVEQPDGDSDHPTASVYTSPTYDNCNFQFSNEKFVMLSPQEMDEVIVHEWLHVAFRDFTEAIHLVDDSLSKPQQAMWDDALDHAEETLIDRLSRQIVANLG